MQPASNRSVPSQRDADEGHSSKWRLYTALISLMTSLCCAVLLLCLDPLINRYIRSTLVIQPVNDSTGHSSSASDLFRQWSQPDVPIRFRVYLFNYSNTEHILAGGSKPEVSQVGPFTFAEQLTKTDINFVEQTQSSDSNVLVRYKPVRTFHYLPHESVGNMSAEDLQNLQLTQPNIPLFTLVAIVGRIPLIGSLVLRSIRSYVSDPKLDPPFLTRSAAQLMFDGYTDPLIATLQSYTSWILPEAAKNNSFGLLYPRNATWDPLLDGEWEVHTGADARHRLGEIYSWNSANQLSCWTPHDSACNQLTGTDGSMFPPPIERGVGSKLSIFNAELSRSLDLEYHSDSSVGPLKTLRFKAPRSVFNAPTEESENACFCPHGDHTSRTCSLDGVLDMSACTNGAPILISAPHFLHGSRQLIDSISGLAPDVHRHQTFIDVEPLTGLVLNGYRRVQINIRIRPESRISELKNLTDLILPVAWFEESVRVPDATLEQLKSQLHDNISLVRVILLCSAISGAMLALLILLLTSALRGSDIRRADPLPVKMAPEFESLTTCTSSLD